MAELLGSRVIIQEEAPSIRTVQGIPTGTCAIIGIFDKGPIGVSTLTTSFKEAAQIFGSDTLAGDGIQAVRGFYQNGGQRLYITRTVHYTNQDTLVHAAVKATLNLKTETAAASAGTALGTIAGPYSLADGDTLSFSIDGGGSDVATFNAAAATLTSTNTETFNLTNLDSMTFDVVSDGNITTQTIVFNTTEFGTMSVATAAEVAAVINAESTLISATAPGTSVIITSDQLGNAITINNFADAAGAPVAALGFTAATNTGSGDAKDASLVTATEIVTLIAGDVTGATASVVGGAVQVVSDTTGGSSTVQVEVVSTMDDELGFDNATHTGLSGVATDTLQVDGKYEGTYGNDLTIRIEAATQLPAVAADFNLMVLDGGVIIETWPNVTMDDAATNFVETVVNHAVDGSRYIAVTDLDLAAGNALAERPGNSAISPAAYGPLTGGDDGLGSLTDQDFIGLDGSGGKSGIRTLDQVQDVSLLIIPDFPTPAVHNAMLTYCEVTRDKSIFAVLDPPSGTSRTGMVTYVETTASILNFSEFGAIYWPQVLVVNPNTTLFGDTTNIQVPPSGHVAGMMARNDQATGGVYTPPAGIPAGRLFGVVGFEDDAVLEQATRDILMPKRINPITKLPGQPIVVDGARTLLATGNFPYVSERRGVIFIEQSLKAACEFARNKNNDRRLRTDVDSTITAFLLIQMAVGAFRTKDPATAFFVDVSEALNPPSEVFAGKLNARIGLATQKPAEFIILSFSQDTRALDEELAAAGV